MAEKNCGRNRTLDANELSVLDACAIATNGVWGDYAAKIGQHGSTRTAVSTSDLLTG